MESVAALGTLGRRSLIILYYTNNTSESCQNLHKIQKSPKISKNLQSRLSIESCFRQHAQGWQLAGGAMPSVANDPTKGSATRDEEKVSASAEAAARGQCDRKVLDTPLTDLTWTYRTELARSSRLHAFATSGNA
jgi:hypothetical protein